MLPLYLTPEAKDLLRKVEIYGIDNSKKDSGMSILP